MILEDFDKMILKAIADQPELVGWENGELPRKVAKRIVKFVRKSAVKQITKALKKSAPGMLKEARARTDGFEKRTFKRWKKPFDLFEQLIAMAIEIGEDVDAELTQVAQEEDFVFEALRHLHPRSILNAQEIYCLLKGGFPDGALARWRSLHEVAVTAVFISQSGNQTALNYLGSFVFNARRAANQLNEYAERAGLEPFHQKDLNDLDVACDATEKQLGRAIGADYGWAREALGRGPKSHISLLDLEKHVCMDHWRPRYRWASQHTHAGHRPPDKSLAMCEAEEPLHIVGGSNSGFVDPLQMAAISLATVSSVFLLHKPTFERITLSEIMQKYADEIGPLAIREEEKSSKKSRKKKR